MLNMLRADLENEKQSNIIEESTVKGVDTDLRDAFLEDLGEDDIEVDEDPELSAFVKKIPEYDEEKEINKRLKRLAESFIPEYAL